MMEFIDCPHCGKQGVIQGYEGERCLFCEKLLRPGGKVNKIAPVPERPQGKNMYEISWYYEENREAILKDLDTMGEKPMLERWKISQATWNGLKCRWRPQIYGPGKSKTHRQTKCHHLVAEVTGLCLHCGKRIQKPKPEKALSVSAEYFAGYQQAVQDGAPKIFNNAG